MEVCSPPGTGGITILQTDLLKCTEWFSSQILTHTNTKISEPVFLTELKKAINNSNISRTKVEKKHNPICTRRRAGFHLPQGVLL